VPLHRIAPWNGREFSSQGCRLPPSAFQMLRRLVGQHEHQLILRRRLWPNDDELAKPIGEHLFVLSTFAVSQVAN
jgi:hypothetical protein